MKFFLFLHQTFLSILTILRKFSIPVTIAKYISIQILYYLIISLAFMYISGIKEVQALLGKCWKNINVLQKDTQIKFEYLYESRCSFI